MKLRFRRLKNWITHGPGISLRLFLVSFIGLFLLNTILLGSIGYLIRENSHRVDEIRAAIIISCRDSNEVRAEIRKVIQEIKNVPLNDATIAQQITRYNRLTKAQAFMVDKRCIPLRTNLKEP